MSHSLTLNTNLSPQLHLSTSSPPRLHAFVLFLLCREEMTLIWMCSHTEGSEKLSQADGGGLQSAMFGRGCMTLCGRVTAFISGQPALI